MRRLAAVAVLAMLLLPGRAPAKDDWTATISPQVMKLPQVATIELAEREGAIWSRTSSKESSLARHWIGTHDRKCVQATAGSVEMRSGEIVIGGDLSADDADPMLPTSYSPRNNRPAKIWWAPVHPPGITKAGLLVRGSLLGSRADTFRMTFTRIAYPVPSHDKKAESFFPSGTTFPKAGFWLVIAVAGDDWGCFVLRAK